jgi:AraC-like DNA-binding protein
MQLRLLESPAARVVGGRSPLAPVQLYRDQPSVAVDGTRVRFWRPFPRKGADVVCGEGTVSDVSFHAHERLQILLPLSPFAIIGGAGRTTELQPGSIHVTGPLELRAARSVAGAPFGMRVILVAQSVVTAIGHTENSGDLLVHDSKLYDELMTVFDALRRPLMTSQCESRLLDCLARLFGQHAARTADLAHSRGRLHGGVVRARDYLRANPVQNVTLDELARIAGLSKFYLLRSFYRAYGLTPHGYQMQLRLARARRLLDDGRPLSHVTYDAGFADQSHLTRRFAAFYGLTPARYGRQLAAAPGAPSDVTARSARAFTPPSAA